MAYENSGIVLIIVGIIVTLLIIHMTLFVKRQRAIRAFYEVVWKKSSSLNPEKVLGRRPFNEYHEREQDKELNKLLSENKNTLVIGQPLAGKTRTIYQALINLNKACDVLIPRCLNIDIESFLIPEHLDFWKKRLIFIDDLQRFVEMENFDHLFKEATKNDFIIVATCRSSFEFKKVKAKFLDKNIGLETIFEDNIIEIDKVSPELGNEIAKKAKIDWDTVKFDGTIGSIFMKLGEMEKRYEECPDIEKTILQVIKKLHISGVYDERQIFPLNWIQTVSINDGIQGKAFEWNSWLNSLKDKDFIKKDNDKIWSEETYLENIINLEKTDLLVFDEMITTFSDSPDVLYKIGNRAYETGYYILEKADYMKAAIKTYQKALEVWTLERFPMDYAMTQNNLGNAYGTLGEIEEKAQNCKLAVKAYQEALEVWTLERFPMDYAMTQNNLGNAYRKLGEVEEKAQNCKSAIEACQEALKVVTFERFPMEYALIQNNFGIAHQTLGQVEKKAQNCKSAIKAYQEALKVTTLERFPMDYAMTQNNLGNAYRTLGEAEEKAQNCKSAIKAYQEALKVTTLERFPMDYTMTQNNLGNAYGTLGQVEDLAKNCKFAVKAYQEALKVRTLEKFPMQYAMTQNNLGNAYQTLGQVEDQVKNCKFAVKVYVKALKVRTLERFPMDYAMTQNNLGNAYRTLGEVEDKDKNCKSAIKAYQKALKVYTKDGFPEVNPIVENNIKILKENCPDKSLS